MPIAVHLGCLIRQMAKDLDLDDVTSEGLLQRFNAEGPTFLTKTLPNFCKTLIRCIELGGFNISPETRCTFFKLSKFDRIPRIFRVQLLSIFNRRGYLRNTANSGQALYTIRQFSEYMYKLAAEFQESSLVDSCNRYSETEREVCEFSQNIHTQPSPWLLLMRKNLVTYYKLQNVYQDDIFNRRRDLTPGSFAYCNIPVPPTVLKRSPWGLRRIPFNYQGSMKLYKHIPHYKKRVCFGFGVQKVIDRTCQVLFVPKDSRGPRVISKEPLHLLPVQMAYLNFMYDHLAQVTKGRILFRDQSVHRELARIGSITKSWSTFDLKDASDRVSHKLVSFLMRDLPLRKVIESFRSVKAELPDGSVLKLNKLAGMGSGFTFPTMALLIHLAVSTVCSEKLGLSFEQVSQNVYVYGDDLIVPTSYARYIRPALELVGLKLNIAKSFVNSHFRESCGADYYNGVNVTPVRLRLSSAKIPKHICSKDGVMLVSSPGGLLQLERHCRELVTNGLYNTTRYFYELLENTFGPLPAVSSTDPFLGRMDKYPSAIPSTLIYPISDRVTVGRKTRFTGIDHLWMYSESLLSDRKPIFPNLYESSPMNGVATRSLRFQWKSNLAMGLPVRNRR